MGMINWVKALKVNLQDDTLPAKTYAQSQSRGRMDVDALAKHMSEHNCPYSKGIIKGILEDFQTCTRELICDGWIVDLGNLGTFNVTLKSKGVAESVADDETGIKPVFTADNITAVNVRYKPGDTFQNMIDDCQFNEVSTLKAQAEAQAAKDTKIAAGTYVNVKS